MLNTVPTSYSQEAQVESLQKDIHSILEQLPLFQPQLLKCLSRPIQIR